MWERCLEFSIRKQLFVSCVCMSAYITLGISDNTNYIVGSYMLCFYVLIICIKGLHAQISYWDTLQEISLLFPLEEIKKFLERAYLHDIKDVPFVTICGATIFTLRNSVLQVSVSGYALPVRNVLNAGARTSHKSIYVRLNNEEARQKKVQAEYLLISLVQTSNLDICLFQRCRCPWPWDESIKGSTGIAPRIFNRR